MEASKTLLHTHLKELRNKKHLFVNVGNFVIEWFTQFSVLTLRRLRKACHGPDHTRVAAFGFGAAFLQERLMIFAN